MYTYTGSVYMNMDVVVGQAATIRPIMSGNRLGEVVVDIPGKTPLRYTDKDAEAIMKCVIGRTIANGNGTGNHNEQDTPVAPKQHRVSAEGRKRISEAQVRRHAEERARKESEKLAIA